MPLLGTFWYQIPHHRSFYLQPRPFLPPVEFWPQTFGYTILRANESAKRETNDVNEETNAAKEETNAEKEEAIATKEEITAGKKGIEEYRILL